MQISMRFVLGCAALLSISPLTVCRAQTDTSSQDKLRQALEQKLNESSNQPAPQVIQQPAPVTQPVQQPAPAPMREPAPLRIAPAPAASVPAPQTSAQPVPSSPQRVTGPSGYSALPAGDAQTDALMRQALEQKLGEEQVRPVSAQPTTGGPVVAPVPPHRPPPAPPHAPGKPTSFPVIAAPASPLSADKQQRLADLLQKYKSDQITPEQYHQERARILNGQ